MKAGDASFLCKLPNVYSDWLRRFGERRRDFSSVGKRLCLCEEERIVEKKTKHNTLTGEQLKPAGCGGRGQGEEPQNLSTLGTSQEKMSRPK